MRTIVGITQNLVTTHLDHKYYPKTSSNSGITGLLLFGGMQWMVVVIIWFEVVIFEVHVVNLCHDVVKIVVDFVIAVDVVIVLSGTT